MSEFDDDLIADALQGRAARGDVWIDGALAAVTGRAAATRRRRAAVAGMGAVTGVVAVAALAFAGGSHDVVRSPNDSSPVTVASTDADVPDTGPSSTDAPNSTDRSPTSTAGETTSSSPSPSPSPSDPGTAVVPDPGGVPPSSTPASTVPVTAPPASTTPVSSPATTAPETTAVQTTEPETTEPETTEPDDDDQATPPFSGRPYTSGGGSITVSWSGSSLSLGGVSPAAGYTASIEEESADRIRVRFSGTDDWRIEVRADGDGVVTSSVSS